MAKNFVPVLALAALASTGLAAWVSIGPDGGNILALALDPQQPATLYALPYEYPDFPRLFRTSSGGASWASVGRLTDYNVNTLVVDPHQSGYLYGLTSTAVLRSTDGGASWTSYPLPGSAMGITADPVVAGRLFACGYSYTTYPVPVVFTSTDYGQSWSAAVLDPDTGYAYCVACDPSQAGIAYAGCAYGLVFKTTDAGAHWSLANAGLTGQSHVQDMAVNTQNPAIVLAAASDGIFRSTDAGGSWVQAGTMRSAFQVELTAANPSLGYCAGYDTVAHLYVSTDYGATWAVQPSNLQLGKGGGLVTDPGAGDVLYLGGVTGVLKSVNRGANWTGVNSGIRVADISTISVSPWNRRGVYVECYENGVFKSASAGDTWTRCSDFLSCGNICEIGLAQGVDADILWALEGSG